MSDTKALDEILKVAKCTQFPFEMIDQAAAELVELKRKEVEFDAVYKLAEEINDKNVQLRADIGNLLAIMHRDGGHHEGEVGTHQATEDAIKVYYALRAELDEATEIIAYSDKCNKTPKVHRGDNGAIRAWSLESEHQFAISAFLAARPERK